MPVKANETPGAPSRFCAMKRQLPDTSLGESMKRANGYALLIVVAIFLLF